LVQWAGLPAEEATWEKLDATWEKLDDFRQQFPDVQLEDELFEKVGRDVMVGLQYARKRPSSGPN
jgi:hypothetical protein